MPADIITTEELNYQLDYTRNMDRTSRSWRVHFGWYPRMQACHYRRIDQVYLESRQIYGDGHFLRYATRRRLVKKFMLTADDVKAQLNDRKSLGIDDGRGMHVPRTTNGEYGRLKPTSLHYC